MTEPAIQVDRLSKSYRLPASGQRDGRAYATLRDDLAALVPRIRERSRRPRTPGETLWALRDVSFDVGQGEVVGIIGRNGAGKSTLLKLLSRITEPTSGSARLHGRVGSLLEVGTGFHPELTGRENIYLSGAVLGMRRGEVQRRFDEIVAFAEVERFLDTPAKHYSSGMYMRLAFAVAAHLEPEILLVDEVLAVGDAEFQKKCLGKIGEVAHGGRTVLFVSHNMSAILSLCPKTLWLHDGRLEAHGDTPGVVDRYLQSGRATETVEVGRRRDRRGEGGIQVTTANVANASGDPLIRSDSRLRFTLGFEATESIRNATFLIEIWDLATSALVYFLQSDLEPDAAAGELSRGTLECVTGPINLTFGRCYVSVGVLKGPLDGGRLLDYVDSALYLDVEPGQTGPAGMLPRSWSLCVIEQDWRLTS